MNDVSARFVGVELYFDDLERAKKFYAETLGLKLSEERVGHFAKFDGDEGFICLETKGSESYPIPFRRQSRLVLRGSRFAGGDHCDRSQPSGTVRRTMGRSARSRRPQRSASSARLGMISRLHVCRIKARRRLACATK